MNEDSVTPGMPRCCIGDLQSASLTYTGDTLLNCLYTSKARQSKVATHPIHSLPIMDDPNAKQNHVEPVQQSTWSLRALSPTIAFLIVSFSLGELGDGLNIFQGIYLVGIGWNEGSVGTALSLMGFTALVMQTFAGDIIDKTTVDRRLFLTTASVLTALSASTIFFVREGNQDHGLIFISKVIEGISSSFIGPCLAALTLATFGPHHFDTVMASNILWGHIGSIAAAGIAGVVAYTMYPDIKLCFLVISVAALGAVFFVQYLPEGDRQMGRGFHGKIAMDEFGYVEVLVDTDIDGKVDEERSAGDEDSSVPPTASTYWEIISNKRSFVLCMTGFFFHFANANVLLVLGELMGGNDDDGPSRSAIPLIAGAIVLAQLTMTIATWTGNRMTHVGVGRKPLFMAGLLTLPVRCALIINWKDAGSTYLLSTQILDGLGGGFFGLLHPYLVADITFGTGRFNLLMGLTASMFGLGATLSNFLGQHVVEMYGHVASLTGSLVISVVPIVIFGLLMPETLGDRGVATGNQKSSSSVTAEDDAKSKLTPETAETDYVEMS